jgi:hypothetical protein
MSRTYNTFQSQSSRVRVTELRPEKFTWEALVEPRCRRLFILSVLGEYQCPPARRAAWPSIVDCCDHCNPQLQPSTAAVLRKKQDATPAHNSPAYIVLLEIRKWIEAEAIPAIYTDKKLLAPIPADLILEPRLQNRLAHLFWYSPVLQRLVWALGDEEKKEYENILREWDVEESLKQRLIQHLMDSVDQMNLNIQYRPSSQTQGTTAVDENSPTGWTGGVVDSVSASPAGRPEYLENVDVVDGSQGLRAREENLRLLAMVNRYHSQQSDMPFEVQGDCIPTQTSESRLGIKDGSEESTTSMLSSGRLRKPSEKARANLEAEASVTTQKRRRRETIRRGEGSKRTQVERSSGGDQ